MFSFFKKKTAPAELPAALPLEPPPEPPPLEPPPLEPRPELLAEPAAMPPEPPAHALEPHTRPAPEARAALEPAAAAGQPAEPAKRSWLDRFRKAGPSEVPAATPPVPATEPLPSQASLAAPEPVRQPAAPLAPIEPIAPPEPREPATLIAPSEAESGMADVEPAAEARRPWFDRLKLGLRRTGSGIAQVFTGTRIDEALYEELEAALLMADAGVQATEHLLADLKRRVKESKADTPAAVKLLLADAVAALLAPLEKALVIGEAEPTVIMVAGVNGAGKTTTIGKLTRHLAQGGVKVLLAAADTFRAAAREQLAVWADRNRVEIVSQEGGDPAAVSFDAVKAGQARGCEVVIADTAGRLPTQLHLMDELKKIQRTIGKAMPGAPHEVLLVVDGNTGQNALAQVKSFDAALGLTGLIVTKLDGTAKGGVLAAIALWSRERERTGGRPVPVYFVGVGEKLEDLQTFSAREFAQALLS
ncbi:MAG: signal recognition particle-docking protein FtsY [Methylibium sp.]|uniref:signal recognition particle-docking protein FtsY n=1 Tax=Methylibium sp. TaxID=2067992 RepID=UPI0017F26463|nr:signal recognition particle-docking protein FtsY [Methylibium sp.]MBA3599263.1 signal recognition particle-docking protein FtsY [Methylibium sp.]